MSVFRLHSSTVVGFDCWSFFLTDMRYWRLFCFFVDVGVYFAFLQTLGFILCFCRHWGLFCVDFILSSYLQTSRVVVKKGRRFLCRTCGEGFSTMARREKHLISNACTKSSVERKYECNICKKMFRLQRTRLTHESWCRYKHKKRLKDAANKSKDSYRLNQETGERGRERERSFLLRVCLNFSATVL